VNRARSLSTILAVVAAVAAVLVGLVTPAAAAAPYCGTSWGSLPKVGTGADSEVLTDVRAGRHDCYDRLVIDLTGQDNSFRSYDVRYVGQVSGEATGTVVPLRGGAKLRVIVRAPAYDQHGATYTPGNPAELANVTGYPTFRQIAWAGSFEGQSTIGLGVRARLPFRVLSLAGTPNSDQGPRLVIDVAHSW